MNPLLRKVLTFVLRDVLKKNKEATADVIIDFGLALTYLKHNRNFKKDKLSELVPPNKTILFPLPNRWTNQNSALSMQTPQLQAMQKAYSMIADGPKKSKAISESKDKSLKNAVLM